MFLAARGLRDQELGGERRFEREMVSIVHRQAWRVWLKSVAAALVLSLFAYLVAARP